MFRTKNHFRWNLSLAVSSGSFCRLTKGYKRLPSLNFELENCFHEIRIGRNNLRDHSFSLGSSHKKGRPTRLSFHNTARVQKVPVNEVHVSCSTGTLTTWTTDTIVEKKQIHIEARKTSKHSLHDRVAAASALSLPSPPEELG